MRKLSSALVLSSTLVGSLGLAQGCSSKGPEHFFEDPTPAADKGSAGGDGGAKRSVDGGAGPSFGNDAVDGQALLDDGSTCASAVTAETHRDPVYLLFVVDGSGSMKDDNKWVAQTAALDAIFDDMLAQQDKDVGVGLVVFSDKLDPTQGSGPYPSSQDIFVSYVDQTQHDNLRARLDLSGASGGTPTFPAMTGAYKELENLVVAQPLPPNGRKVLVILTDGVPNTGGTQQQCVDLTSTELAKVGPRGPILTFAVGVGRFPSSDPRNYDPAFMGNLAQAGGTAPAGCSPTETSSAANLCHFQVTPNGKPVDQVKQDFVDAINKIRGQVSSCEFTLERPDGGGTAVDPGKVNVIYTDGNGVQHYVPQDPNSGWTYDDPAMPGKVVLNGSSCTQMKGDAKAKVTVQLGCKTKTN